MLVKVAEIFLGKDGDLFSRSKKNGWERIGVGAGCSPVDETFSKQLEKEWVALNKTDKGENG